MSSYQQHALDGASAVDLVVALYDGMIRFLHSAADAVDRGDAVSRRIAVRRALDIIVHLQARLKMEVGGEPARALSEFYASIFAQIIRASQAASRPQFEHAIGCVRNVREAWKQVASDVNRIESASDHLSISRAVAVRSDDDSERAQPSWRA